ncbi:MAG: Creatinine amidohydrolase, partial [Pseudonocardia sp.]|nr:Creatinine amidohydrolase [Pseudonocardia sp.]
MAPVPRFVDLTAPQVAALPADTVAVLPLGAIEQHGPHLPVSTDYVTATEAADAAVAAVAQEGSAPVVLLPGLAYTKSDEHHWSPGTIWLSWDTLMRTLVDIGRSLKSSGITRLLFVNGHGGNSALGQVACREIRRQFGLRTFFAHLSVPVDQGGSGSAASEHGMGIHGGHSETSLMLHLRPELVHLELAGCRVPEGLREFDLIGFGKPVSFGWTSD